MSPSFIRLKALLALALTAIVTTAVLFAEPTWWVTRGVRDPAKPASDYAALNQGQLKNLARAARDEMNEKLPGGAGEAINNLVNSWSSPTDETKDYAMVNQGQLKAVAELFYARYDEFGIHLTRPWSHAQIGDSDYAGVNLGQAKNAFGFRILDDTDGDGLLDQDEWQRGTSITKADTDDDGISDFLEMQEGTDALDHLSNSKTLLNLRVFTQFEAAS